MPFFDERHRKRPQGQEQEDGLADSTALFVPLRDPGAPVVDDYRRDDEDDDQATADLPQITRMPEGFSVVEQQIGHATGQWVFVVLCECGRRWFALHQIETAQCPRCERWVQVETDKNARR